jgi:hypothetical protein
MRTYENHGFGARFLGRDAVCPESGLLAVCMHYKLSSECEPIRASCKVLSSGLL